MSPLPHSALPSLLARVPLVLATAVPMTATAIGAGVVGCLGGLMWSHRRTEAAAPVDSGPLVQANHLLAELTAVARTLPTPLNARDAVQHARELVHANLTASVVCLLEHDATSDEWVPKLAEACVLRPTARLDELPAPIREAAGRRSPVLHGHLAAEDAIGMGSASGMYAPLVVGQRMIGVLAVEHRSGGRYAASDLELLEAISGDIALTLDNARWFGRLRSFGSEEERVRAARDLNDRLGQWLTYVSFELERLITAESADPSELTKLYGDVQAALEELRDTIRQLRSGVSDGRPLSVVGAEVVASFVERTDVEATFTATTPDAFLSVPVEHELLRILQEALVNVGRHARAGHVEVTWTVGSGTGTLTIRDDGVGFEHTRGVRENAYGLVQMRERADAVGARLNVSSAPGAGTTIIVTAGGFTGAKEV